MLDGEHWRPVAHHASHAHLIRSDWPENYQRSVSAVVVPASRPSWNLGPAVRLAEELGCPLVVACSARAEVAEVALELERWQGVAFRIGVEPPVAVRRLRTRQLALDTPADDPRVPRARREPAGDLTGRALLTRARTAPDGAMSQAPYVDVSTKRNVALLLARQLGWRRLLFLDDDIQPPPAREILRATAMLGPSGASMASWPAQEFPDNSVVCHARRVVGLEQGTFLAGGCLLVDLTRTLPYFPGVYNEDWLFCWEAVRDRRMAMPGSVDQMPYNPFDPRRATREEFGDVLGEGLFALLHRSPADVLLGLVGQGPAAERARQVEPARYRGYWSQVLAGRHAMLAEVTGRLEARAATDPEAAVQLRAVRAGQERLNLITPYELAEFVALWLQDLQTWRYELAQLHRQETFKGAFNQLGIDEFQRVGVM
ncbi:hypothetical protein GCM10022223_35510 [Kineosporia mesophila]|uniref:Uncharacterized protein n=1 Tax=Kineosporia mesophila TaxID=566012 RepID=A0ABP6ZSJ7_9ACTN|nr:hypothetical protein [Kineosporia mesophila]MCD5350021.1 hypothetical protein [Kineosporia mesophila]